MAVSCHTEKEDNHLQLHEPMSGVTFLDDIHIMNQETMRAVFRVHFHYVHTLGYFEGILASLLWIFLKLEVLTEFAGER